MLLNITLFRGYGGISQGVLLNIRKVAETLSERGFIVVVREVSVPAIDLVDDFTPFVLVNGVEVHVPSVDVDVEVLADYIVETAMAYENMLGLPMPPMPSPEKGAA